jgi:hypothetical protein
MRTNARTDVLIMRTFKRINPKTRLFSEAMG